MSQINCFYLEPVHRPLFHLFCEVFELTLKKSVVQQVCAYAGIFGDIAKWLPTHAEKAGWQNDDRSSASRCLANTDGTVRKWRLKKWRRIGKESGGMQWDVFAQIETASCAEWKQSVLELNWKIMGARGGGKRWRVAIERWCENTRQIQWRSREWAKLKEGAVYQREESSECEEDS